MGVQLTPGQKCLLDLTQRKLLNTIEAYKLTSLKRLELEKQLLDSTASDTVGYPRTYGSNDCSNSSSSNSTIGGNDNDLSHVQLNSDDAINNKPDDKTNIIDKTNILTQIHISNYHLERLKAKIGRISARQKRFTNEIIHCNGNNTIPKESYFKSLGLITKDALEKINLKSGERRRRTTANPRFSHEAIQAKRALESHNQLLSANNTLQQTTRTSNRLEERASRGLTSGGGRALSNGERGNNRNIDTPNSGNGRRNYRSDNNSSGAAYKSSSSRARQPNSNSQNETRPKARPGRPSNRTNATGNKARSGGNIGRPRNPVNNNNITRDSNEIDTLEKPAMDSFAETVDEVGIDDLLPVLTLEEKKRFKKNFALLQHQLFAKIGQIRETRQNNSHLMEENRNLEGKQNYQTVGGVLNLSRKNRIDAAADGSKEATNENGIDLSDMPLNLVKSSKMSSYGKQSLKNIDGMYLTNELPLKNGSLKSADIFDNLKCDESLDALDHTDTP